MKNETAIYEPTHLDLFSGIGGFALAAQLAGFRTIGFCEIDKYCQKVLAKNFLADAGRERQSAGRIQNRERAIREIQHDRTASGGAVIHSNIFDLDGRQFAGVDLITGGFPCQPFSVAGNRRGAADDRAIWPQMFRVIREARPAFVLGENVSGIIPMELDNVLSDLEGIGYATRAFVIPACAVDARHRRDRVWIIGRNMEHSECAGLQRFRSEHELRIAGAKRQTYGTNYGSTWNCCRWLPEPAVGELVNGVSNGLVRFAGRVATKVPNRIQKLKALGNSIAVPLAYEILREIRKLL